MCSVLQCFLYILFFFSCQKLKEKFLCSIQRWKTEVQLASPTVALACLATVELWRSHATIPKVSLLAFVCIAYRENIQRAMSICLNSQILKSVPRSKFLLSWCRSWSSCAVLYLELFFLFSSNRRDYGLCSRLQAWCWFVARHINRKLIILHFIVIYSLFVHLFNNLFSVNSTVSAVSKPTKVTCE